MNLSAYSLREKINILSFLGIALLMPLNRAADSLMIGVFTLTWLLGRNFSALKRPAQSPYLYIMISLYLIHLVGLLYTSNMSAGLFDIQVKLSILLLPLGIYAIPHLRELKWTLLKCFAVGCILAGLYCFCSALVKYSINGDSGVFFYSSFSQIMHPGYFAMYCCFALSIIFHFIFIRKEVIRKRLYKAFWYFGAFFLMLVVGLLSSKTGILSLCAIFIIVLIYFLISKKYVNAGIIILVSGLFFFVFIKYLSISYSRLKKAQEVMMFMDKNQSSTIETTAVRLLVWKASLEIINHHLAIGVGTGDAKDELISKYKEKGLVGAYENKLNTHNEFLHITVALGLVGLFLLLATLIYPLVLGIRDMDLLLVLLVTCLCINFITEAMLETQAGVVFFSFFLSYMVFSRQPEAGISEKSLNL